MFIMGTKSNCLIFSQRNYNFNEPLSKPIAFILTRIFAKRFCKQSMDLKILDISGCDKSNENINIFDCIASKKLEKISFTNCTFSNSDSKYFGVALKKVVYICCRKNEKIPKTYKK
jgi:hypothetical protein